MNPSVGQERSSVGCGGLWRMLTKLMSRTGGSGQALLPEALGRRRGLPEVSEGLIPQTKGPVLFRTEGWSQVPAWALAGWLTSLLFPHNPPSPHPLDELRCQGQWGSVEDLGLGRRDY